MFAIIVVAEGQVQWKATFADGLQQLRDSGVVVLLTGIESEIAAD